MVGSDGLRAGSEEPAATHKGSSVVLRRWGLVAVLLLAGVLRVAYLAQNVRRHYAFFFQPRAEILARLAGPDTPYVNVFGFEVSNIAYSWICKKHGFSSPFGGDTGPTAWIAPGLATLYAASFAFFGCFTAKSILALFVVALVLSLAICWLTYQNALLLFGDHSTALLAALLFALAPFDLWLFRVASAMELNVYTFFLALLLYLGLRYWHSPVPRNLLAWAATTGIAVLTYPGFALCSLAVVALRLVFDRPTRAAAHVLLFAVVAGTLVFPYLVWQRTRLGGWVPVKSNGPFELYLGNTQVARGFLSDTAFELHHPSQNHAEFLRYRQLGELGYVREKFHEFLQRLSVPRFIATSSRRLVEYFFAYEKKSWDSSAVLILAKRFMWALPGAILILFPVVRHHHLDQRVLVAYTFVLTFALPFLLAGVMERYRLPISTVVAVLAAGLLLGGAPEAADGRATHRQNQSGDG
jgi:hypothetical protein